MDNFVSAPNSQFVAVAQMLSEAIKKNRVETDARFNNVTIERGEGRIVLPNGMSYEEAIVWLQRRIEEENKDYGIYHTFDCFPADGVVALNTAMAKLFGWTGGIPTPGFFGSSNPPSQIGIPIGVAEDGTEKTVQAIFGRLVSPSIQGFIDTGWDVSTQRAVFVMQGQAKQRCKGVIQNLAEQVAHELRHNSIYKRQAVRMDLSWMRDERPFDLIQDSPKFINLHGLNENDLILSREAQKNMEIGIFAPIERSEALRTNKIPLRRSVLLSGPFGVGKSLSASVTALKAVRSGWTFIYLNDVQDLAVAYRMASLYAPAVIFAEDVDRVVTGQRSPQMDQILNAVDGVDSKNKEIMLVLTTNNLSAINPALLRPGRIDTLIELGYPDEKAAEALLRKYGAGLISQNEDLKEVSNVIANRNLIPAVIREVTERSKIAAICRSSSDATSVFGKVTSEDLVNAVESIESHRKLLNPDAKKHSEFEVLGKRMARTIDRLQDLAEDEDDSIVSFNGDACHSS